MLSRCHSGIRTSRATAERWKYKGNFVRSSWFLLARHADSTEIATVHSTQYTVQYGRPQADGLPAQLASLRYNTTGSPLIEPIRNSRRTGSLALTRRRWTDSRTKHQTANSWSVWSTAQSVHQQTYVIQSICRVESIRFDFSGGD